MSGGWRPATAGTDRHAIRKSPHRISPAGALTCCGP